jgi:hypothetical protein
MQGPLAVALPTFGIHRKEFPSITGLLDFANHELFSRFLLTPMTSMCKYNVTTLHGRTIYS